MSVPVDRMNFAERANFLVTNRIPRRLLTLFMGWFSRIEFPPVRWLSISCWRLFSDDLRLEEARNTSFRSMHDCFTRELREGARPVDPDPAILSSPCDAVVGQFGAIRGLEVIQAKGFPYRVEDLLGDAGLARTYEGGSFVTLRLKSSMYHRFHAPCDGDLDAVTYISGDVWNVNPPALKAVERLFCRNERAVLTLDSKRHGPVTLVPVAAILVASMRIHGLPGPLDLRYAGPNFIACDIPVSKGEELGYFEQGSTIIMFVTEGFQIHEDIATGRIIRMGRPLLRNIRRVA